MRSRTSTPLRVSAGAGSCPHRGEPSFRPSPRRRRDGQSTASSGSSIAMRCRWSGSTARPAVSIASSEEAVRHRAERVAHPVLSVNPATQTGELSPARPSRQARSRSRWRSERCACCRGPRSTGARSRCCPAPRGRARRPPGSGREAGGSRRPRSGAGSLSRRFEALIIVGERERAAAQELGGSRVGLRASSAPGRREWPPGDGLDHRRGLGPALAAAAASARSAPLL